ncbi:sulfatase-like hydrolase/transferase [Thermodesulfobacteriota bacterium]
MGLFSKEKEEKPTAPPARRPALRGMPPRPAPAFPEMNNYIIVILDSCRYDSFMTANPKTIMRLGETECRYTYASWTAPSHFNLLMGLVPHTSPPQVYASEYYKNDFIRYNERFGVKEFEFKSLVPQLYLPPFMRNKLGYKTHAMVSLPVLNSMTPINVGFDKFKLMDKHNDMAAMLDEMDFSDRYPSFYLLNVGETHYPYATPDEPENEWPRISGVHGIFKHLDDQVVGGKLVDEGKEEKFFDQDKLDQLRERQINAVKYLDGVFERLFDMVPKNTYITVTADHGELFGEEGYFGHGPIMHKKVFEVPFLEGKIR